MSKAGNVIFNLIFLLDVGGVIAVSLYVAARWPVLIQRADMVLSLAACAVPLLLLAGLLWTHIINPYTRGVTIHGVHYEDTWRDD